MLESPEPEEYLRSMSTSRDSQILEVVRTSRRPRTAFRLKRLFFLTALAFSGCGKKGGTPATQGNGDHATTATSVVAMNKPGTPGYIPPAESQVFVVNGQIDLAALTTALRYYCKWKMRVPKDLNELVTSRYLTNLPAPPPGQKYAIDPTYLEVKL